MKDFLTVRWPRAVGGLAALAVFLGVAEALARLVGGASAPLSAWAALIIPLTPTTLVKAAIALFGTSDKAVLIATISVGAAALAAVLGLLARRLVAVGIFLVLVLATALVVVTRPGAALVDVVPTFVGGAAGGTAFSLLWERLRWTEASPRERVGNAAAPDRRRFLILAGALTVAGTAAIALGRSVASATGNAARALASFVLPDAATQAPAIPAGATVGVDGVAPFLTRQADLYRIDTAIVVPDPDPEAWTLRVHGMVEQEFTLTMDELLALPLDDHHLTLTCVSNPVGGDLLGTGTWRGYPLRELLRRARPLDDADMVLSRSVDGFSASTPIEAMTDGRDALLVVGMNGEPLLPEHGFPARLVIPGLYGYVSATKWVTELEVTRFDAEEAYWTERGWDERGPILVASRIDVPAPLQEVPAGDVVVAGVAWAQQRGVARVDVRLDEGEWMSADLGSEVTIDTWRQWRVVFPDVAPGNHSATVRAVDSDGTVQTGERRDSIPNTATGHHRQQFRVA